MATRPSMSARDSSGRKVSLLNDESTQRLPQQPYDYDMTCSLSHLSARSTTSSPVTPDLIRADSYDSNSHEPHSPITPHSFYDLGGQPSYTSSVYKDPTQFEYRERMQGDEYPSNASYGMSMRPTYESRTPSYQQDTHMFEEESYQQTPNGGPKRYPCRYRDTHNCQKTFTTSGHASRHSKIHTAEKGVSCTFEGCQKKFTRADNMKQHLETHTKERSRSSGISSQKTSGSVSSTLTLPAGVKKPGSSRPNVGPSHHSSRNLNSIESAVAASASASASPDMPPLDPAMFDPTAPMFPSAARAANGLDTLAFAADQMA